MLNIKLSYISNLEYKYIIMFDFLKQDQVLYNEPLYKYTTIGVGGKCKYFVKISPCQLLQCINECKSAKLQYFLIGLGSNILISDSGYDGVVIKVIDNSDIVVNDSNVIVSAWHTMSRLVTHAYEAALSGLEWAILLPSTVGGAIYGNAGANGYCIANTLKSCIILDNVEYKEYNKDDCKFGYRSSIFQNEALIITNATFELAKDSKNNIANKLKTNISKRLTHQPKGKSMGCVFKNCEYSAGKLIDSLNLKGMGIGDAFISDIHANFIINKGSSAQDIYKLIQLTKNIVMEKTGILLNEEIKYIGEF